MDAEELRRQTETPKKKATGEREKAGGGTEKGAE